MHGVPLFAQLTAPEYTEAGPAKDSGNSVNGTTCTVCVAHLGSVLWVECVIAYCGPLPCNWALVMCPPLRITPNVVAAAHRQQHTPPEI